MTQNDRKKNIIIMILILLLGTSVGYFLISSRNSEFKVKSFKEKRNEILSEIDLTLKEATKSGKYKCCIEPPCKMCFLGNWIWKDGTCDCDTLIAEGKMDKVCPECISGIKEGRCISSRVSEGTCPV